jgi:hypothetical protein
MIFNLLRISLYDFFYLLKKININYFIGFIYKEYFIQFICIYYLMSCNNIFFVTFHFNNENVKKI